MQSKDRLLVQNLPILAGIILICWCFSFLPSHFLCTDGQNGRMRYGKRNFPSYLGQFRTILTLITLSCWYYGNRVSSGDTMTFNHADIVLMQLAIGTMCFGFRPCLQIPINHWKQGLFWPFSFSVLRKIYCCICFGDKDFTRLIFLKVPLQCLLSYLMNNSVTIILGVLSSTLLIFNQGWTLRISFSLFRNIDIEIFI